MEKMIPIILVVIAATIVQGSPSIKEQILQYLTAVGVKSETQGTLGPLECINIEEVGWNINHPYVRELVSTVCNYEGDRIPLIKRGCMLFERVAIHYLDGFWKALKRKPQSISKANVVYNHANTLLYDQMKEMFPAVCAKGDPDTTRGCKCMNATAIDYLINWQRILVDRNMFSGMTTQHAQKSCPKEAGSITARAMYGDVKMMLPGVCYGNVDKKIQPHIRGLCDLYTNATESTLRKEPSDFTPQYLKPFIVYMCKDEKTYGKYKSTCDDYLGENLSLLMK